MLSSYYAFNIASIVMFIVISILQGEALREMYEDPHILEQTRRAALEYVLTNIGFGALTTILQIIGSSYSRELIKKHIVYDFSRYERAAYHSMAENGIIYQNSSSRREQQAGLPDEYINALPVITLPNDWKNDIEENQVCVICQEDHQAGETIKSLPCNHKFHSKCIDEWLHRSGACPMCNQNVIELATRTQQNNEQISRNSDDFPPIADVLSITITPNQNSTSSQSTTSTSQVQPPKKSEGESKNDPTINSQGLARHFP